MLVQGLMRVDFELMKKKSSMGEWKVAGVGFCV